MTDRNQNPRTHRWSAEPSCVRCLSTCGTWSLDWWLFAPSITCGMNVILKQTDRLHEELMRERPSEISTQMRVAPAHTHVVCLDKHRSEYHKEQV